MFSRHTRWYVSYLRLNFGILYLGLWFSHLTHLSPWVKNRTVISLPHYNHYGGLYGILLKEHFVLSFGLKCWKMHALMFELELQVTANIKCVKMCLGKTNSLRKFKMSRISLMAKCTEGNKWEMKLSVFVVTAKTVGRKKSIISGSRA